MSDELDNPQADALEPADEQLAARLDDGRPVPSAGFRGALGRRLREHDPGYGPRPERLQLFVTAYAACGVGLLAIGTLLATGAL